MEENSKHNFDVISDFIKGRNFSYEQFERMARLEPGTIQSSIEHSTDLSDEVITKIVNTFNTELNIDGYAIIEGQAFGLTGGYIIFKHLDGHGEGIRESYQQKIHDAALQVKRDEHANNAPVIAHENVPDKVILEDKYEFDTLSTIGLTKHGDFYVKLDFQHITMEDIKLIADLYKLEKALSITSELIRSEQYNIQKIVVLNLFSTSELSMVWECASDEEFSLEL
jgi:hypothetical protein